MGMIKIQRTNEYINVLRDYAIYIDGQKAGVIASGQVKEFAIPPGHHTLYAKIDWCRSPEIRIELAGDEIKNYTVSGFKNGNWIMPLSLGIVLLSFFLSEKFSFYFFCLTIPSFLVLVYYLTLGRKKYLSLAEVLTPKER